jgi:hypothetical protein
MCVVLSNGWKISRNFVSQNFLSTVIYTWKLGKRKTVPEIHGYFYHLYDGNKSAENSHGDKVVLVKFPPIDRMSMDVTQLW